MNVEELMIGDLISYDGEVMVIESLYKHNNRYRINQDQYTINFAKPIPLTAEILEKNGFVVEQVGEEFSIYYCKDGKIVFGFDYDVKEERYWVGLGYFNNIVFNYVHELQRILRLCGLNNLADNFQI